MIDGYKFGEFTIKGKSYKGNVALIREDAKLIRHLDDHRLNLDDFTELINSKPTHIVIGTGAYGIVKPPREIIDFIENQNIVVIVEKTGKIAVRGWYAHCSRNSRDVGRGLLKGAAEVWQANGRKSQA